MKIGPGNNDCLFGCTDDRRYDFRPYTYSDSMKSLEYKLLIYARSVGIGITVTSRVRSCCEQAELYYAGKTTAAPGDSQHEYGLAFDVVPDARTLAPFGATFADGVAWLVALAKFYGYSGLAEGNHAHLQYYENETWKRIRTGLKVVTAIPIPSKSPRRK